MDDSFLPLDEELRNAYEQTIYRVFDPPLDLRIHQLHPSLDKLLEQHRSHHWAFLTSVNPLSAMQTDAANRLLLSQLRVSLESGPWTFYEGAGMGKDGQWPPEPSFLILGISLDKALQLGRRWRQKAIVAGQKGKAAQLHVIPYPDVPGEQDSNP
jgi:hypothetical protein